MKRLPGPPELSPPPMLTKSAVPLRSQWMRPSSAVDPLLLSWGEITYQLNLQQQSTGSAYFPDAFSADLNCRAPLHLVDQCRRRSGAPSRQRPCRMLERPCCSNRDVDGDKRDVVEVRSHKRTKRPGRPTYFAFQQPCQPRYFCARGIALPKEKR